MATLVIVESPAKGRKIEQYLGQDFKVLATRGHIADLSKGGPHNLGVDIDNNFKPRYQLLEDKIDLVKQIFDEASQSDNIWIASDPDREGEAIAWHVASKLAKTGKDIKRVEFHEITKKGVAAGAKTPRELNLDLFHSQEARRVLDRIVGFMVSPFVMNFFGPKLSAGRVQSVVTKMIVDRELEIEAFKPEEYWVLKSCLTKDGKDSFWAKYEPKVVNGKKAVEVKKLLEGNGFDAKYTVTQVKSDEEAKKPPPPMTTSELQRIMARSFNFSASQTMTAAQSLYENGYVTYIRTDSPRADPDAVNALRDWLKQNGYAMPKAPTVYKSGDAAQDAHECIRPTDLTIGPDNGELSGDEKKVYEVIWQCFVASQMMPAIYDTLKVTLQLKGERQHVLKASGKALKTKGFLEIMGVNDNSKIEIPMLSEGDELTLMGKSPVTSEKKQTQPPARFTVDTMIKEMEKRKIGRPATYAETLSKITSRNYVEVEGKSFRPTDLGRRVTTELAKFFTFMAYDYSARLEDKLDLIEHGKQDHIIMLEEFFVPFKKELDAAYTSNGSITCDKCGSPMKERASKTGKFLGCSNYPSCHYTKSLEQRYV